jgi:hypothetical protein
MSNYLIGVGAGLRREPTAAILFDSNRWTARSAKAWAKSQGYHGSWKKQPSGWTLIPKGTYESYKIGIGQASDLSEFQRQDLDLRKTAMTWEILSSIAFAIFGLILFTRR